MPEWLTQRVEKEFSRRAEAGILRQLSAKNQHSVDFSSNDYLGLADHPDVIQAGIDMAKTYGAGSTGSRLTSGNYPHYEKLEDEIAAWLNREAALIFNSGYQMNATIISALAGRDDRVLIDRLAHNSLITGVLNSGAELIRFKHNDVEDLEQRLIRREQEPQGQNIIICESIYSMDGDMAPLGQIRTLARQYQALLIVDEAHALGVEGQQGCGLMDSEDGADIILGTFGKSFGVFGAFVACSNSVKTHIINNCGGFVYSTALPPFVIGSVSKALELIKTSDSRREKIHEVGGFLRHALGIEKDAQSDHIIPYLVGNPKGGLSLQKKLAQANISINAIRYPTVPKHTDRLRISITAQHSMEDAERLLEILREA